VLPIPVVTEKSGGETDQPTRLDYRWIDLRKSDKTKIFKVWTALEKGMRDYWTTNGYIQFYSPALMNAASEGGSEFFTVNYFDRKAYLSQSPQFYKQMAMAAGFEKVFAVGPVFRAEPSFTTRHLTEFTGWDIEVSYIESHHDVMDEEEKALISGFQAVKDAGIEVEVPTAPFPKMTMKEAKAKLIAVGVKGEKEHDLNPEEEKALGKLVKEEFNSDFVFVTDYHKSIRPFYHMRHEDNPDLTMSFDLLYRGVEITTGAKREHRPEVLEKQMIDKGVDPSTLQDYVQFFRYGCPPHGGAGLGPGRIIMGMLDLPNIREATYLPRDVKRLLP
jgi:aspartyl-tRNA synthetase